MAGKLPKVTEYIKNVGKSVAYASIDVIKEPTEGFNDFFETNEDLFKTIYSATKNYRRTMRVVERSIKNSKIYEAANLGFKALKEDLKTGEFYNKRRQTDYEMSSFGEDFADFSDFEDVDFGSWNDSDDGEDSDIEQDGKESHAYVKAMGASTAELGSVISSTSQAQSSVIVASTEALSKTQVTSTKLLFNQNEKINSSIVNGFSGINTGISLVTSIMSGPMTNFMNESTKFYSDISNKINETNAYLKELTEMQRNLYKVQDKQYKNSAYDDIVSSTGMPDITAYAKKIYKNILDLDPTGGMLGGDGDENMFKMFVGSPLKAIPTMISKMIIPTAISKSLEAFDKNMSGIFSTFIARMNTLAEDTGDGDGINIKGLLGRIFGIKMDKKTSVDTSKFQRGPIPFDGETKKAIVDVIPAYLARIESAVSGMPERYYDGKTGKFKTARDIHSDYRNLIEGGYNAAVSSLEPEFDKWAKSQVIKEGTYLDEKQAAAKLKAYKDSFKELGKMLYNNGGDFRPFLDMKDTGTSEVAQTLGLDNDEFISLMHSLFGDPNDKSINNMTKHKAAYDISQNVFDAMRRINNELSNASDFMSPYSYLFDGRLNGIDKNGKIVSFNANSTDIYSKNSKFKSANDYLKDILAEVRYIRMYGGMGKGKGKSSNDPTTPDFDSYLSDFNKETEYVESIERSVSANWYTEAKREEENKKNSINKEAAKYGLDKETLKNTEAGEKVISTWSSMRKKVDDLLKSPAKWITDIIQKADQRVFETFFGNESGETFKDKRGFEYQSFLDYIIGRAGQIFDDFQEKIKSAWKKMSNWFFENTKAGKWLKEKGGAFARDVGGRLKNKFGYAKSRFGKAWGNTYGSLINKMRKGKVVSANDITNPRANIDYGDTWENEADDPSSPYYEGPTEMAYGGVVTKYGMTMLSPGEIVIPNPSESTRRKNLRGEKREKSRILSALKNGRIGHHAQGTTDNESGGKKDEESKVKSAIKTVMNQVGGNGADIAADALIGSGVSLITGMVGGPLLGAAAGAGIGLVKNSEFLQKKLFGDENHEGGLIPKKVTEFFQKNSDGMIDFGIAGAIAGLFTPLGLVGGALAGATLGFTKNTKWFQDMMFGNEVEGKTGLMSEETKKKLQKALPAMGIGAAAGALLGPFGLIGNAVIGSAAGYVVTSEKFKEFILGKEGADGKKEGGLVGALNAGLVQPLTDAVLGKKAENGKREGGIVGNVTDFFKEGVLKPIQNIVETSGMVIKNTFRGLGDRISDALSGVFEKHVGMPFNEWLREKVFKRISGVMSTLLKGAVGVAKFAIKAPLMPLNAVANSVKANQIAKGTRDNMTAAERMDFRDKHKLRFGARGFMGYDRTEALDKSLAGMNTEELEAFTGNVSTFISNQNSNKIKYFDDLRSVGGKLSGVIDNNELWGKNGYDMKKKILKALEKGNFEDVENIMNRYGLTPEQKQQILSTIDIDSLSASRDNMIKESGLTKEAIAQIEGATGMMGVFDGKRRHRANLRRMERLGKAELKYRKAQDKLKTAESEPEPTDPTEVPEEEMSLFDKAVNQQNRNIIDILAAINNNLAAIGKEQGADDIKRVEVSNGQVTKIPVAAINEDSIEAVEEKQQEEEKYNAIVEAINGQNGEKEEEKKDEEEGEQKSLISRLFGMLSGGSGTGSKLMSIIGGAGKTVGIAAAITGGITLLGYAAEYFKPVFNSAIDKLEKSETFQTIKSVISSFWSGIQDGSIFVSLSGFVAEGLNKSLKYIVAPLTEAIITMTPDIIGGIAKGVWAGIKNIFSKDDSETEKNIDAQAVAIARSANTTLNKAINSLPTSTHESQIASHFDGSYRTGTITYNPTGVNFSNTSSTDTYTSLNTTGAYNPGVTYDAPGTYATEGEGSAEIDSNGIVKEYDKNGNYIGSYDQVNGNLIETHYTRDKQGGFRNAVKNALIRGIGTGKVPAVASLIGKVGSKIFSTKSIAKSAAKSGASLGIIGRLTHGAAAAGKTIGRAGTSATSFASKLGVGINNFLSKNSIGEGLTYAKNSLVNGVKNGVENISTKNAEAAAEIANKKPSVISKGLKFVKETLADTKAGQAVTGMKNKVTGSLSSAKDKIIGLGKNLGSSIKDKITGVAKNSTDDVVKVATEVTEEATEGIGSKLIAFGKSFATKGRSFLDTIFKFLKKGTTKLSDSKLLGPLFEKLFKELAEKAVKSAAGRLAKKAAEVALKAVAGLTPITIAFWVKSFADGCALKTESILGVTKDSGLDLGIGARAMVGIVHAINENLLLGLIPTETIMKAVIKIFGGFCGITAEEYEEAQQKTAEILTKAGLDSDSEADLEAYNKQEGLLKGSLNSLKSWVTGQERITYKNNTANNNTSSSGSGRRSGRNSSSIYRGGTRGGQQGGIYAGMKYGGSTIGQSGCAPVAAAKLLGTGIPDAAGFAQSTGHVAADGSTDIGFFNDYFNSKGVSNRTTTSKSDVASALKNGQSAVLLGRDPNGGDESAYSNSSHFITARNAGGNRYVVDDPALGRRLMNKDKVLRNMKASVITGAGRKLRGKGRWSSYRGRGSADLSAQAVVDTALNEAKIGYTEGANNSNKYSAAAGSPNVAWCCYFVWWVFNQVGGSSLLYDGKPIGECGLLLAWFRAKGQEVERTDAKPGDIVFLNFDGGSTAQHVGICVNYSGGSKMDTVEGNTSPNESGSQTNGEGVYEKSRNITSIIAVCRPAYADADLTAAISSGSDTNSTILSMFGDFGKNLVKAMYGENLYNAVFGADSSSSNKYYPSNANANGTLTGSSNAEKIWKYLRSLGYSEQATAAIMGSLYRESSLIPNNLQDDYNTSLGYSDVNYTAAVNSKAYSKDKFMNDEAGYGLAQWTHYSRKANLYDRTVSKGIDVSDMKAQLDFLNHEVENTNALSNVLKNASNVSDANKLFISEFEKPYGYEDSSNALYTKRLETANNFYNQFKGTGRGYANKINTKYYNGGARDDISTAPTVTAGAGTISYTTFLETIITILMSICDNTNTLNRILEILSDKFGINVSNSDITAATSNTQKAREALNQLMTDRSNAAQVTNILQSKNTDYLIEVMSSLARE